MVTKDMNLIVALKIARGILRYRVLL